MKDAKLKINKFLQAFKRAACGLQRKKGFTLMELIVVLAILGFMTVIIAPLFTHKDDQNRFEETQKRMKEIKKAILGPEGAYVNGQRQFSGYVADMGRLPVLVDENGAPDPNGQPKGLWTRDLDGNDDTTDLVDIPDSAIWGYRATSQVWMGWRGPYLEAPPDDILTDGWGNAFDFAQGDLVNSHDDSETYRCYTSHSSFADNCPTSGANYGGYWQKVADGTFGEDWESSEDYSSDFSITSLGANGVITAADTGFDEAITLMLKQTEYMAPVAGRMKAGYTPPVTVTLYVSANGAENPCNTTNGIDSDGYFRFESSSSGNGTYNGNIPVGLRSIIVADAIYSNQYIFTVEPTGNWLGDIELQ